MMQPEWKGRQSGLRRSAGFKPAVTQGFQPADVRQVRARRGLRAFCRLEIGDTAGWKPALQSCLCFGWTHSEQNQ
jgi:hypothetical protein